MDPFRSRLTQVLSENQRVHGAEFIPALLIAIFATFGCHDSNTVTGPLATQTPAATPTAAIPSPTATAIPRTPTSTPIPTPAASMQGYVQVAGPIPGPGFGNPPMRVSGAVVSVQQGVRTLQAVSDFSGDYQVSGLDPGAAQVSATFADGGRTIWAAQFNTTLAPGQNTEDITLAPVRTPYP